MKFEVKNRWSGEVQFTAEIECAEDVKWAIVDRVAKINGNQCCREKVPKVWRG